jgi:hypothetical protein
MGQGGCLIIVEMVGWATASGREVVGVGGDWAEVAWSVQPEASVTQPCSTARANGQEEFFAPLYKLGRGYAACVGSHWHMGFCNRFRQWNITDLWSQSKARVMPGGYLFVTLWNAKYGVTDGSRLQQTKFKLAIVVTDTCEMRKGHT